MVQSVQSNIRLLVCYSSLLLLGMVQYFIFSETMGISYSSLLLLGMVQFILKSVRQADSYSSLLLLGMVQLFCEMIESLPAIVPFYFWVWYN